jgi:hypothetical protein
MKRVLLITLAVCMMLAAVCLIGCGKSGVKVKTENGSLQVSTPKGSLNVEGKMPTEDELGVPIYPNATAARGGSVSTTEGKSTYTAAVPLVTDDSVSEVVAWYKEKLAGMQGLKDMTTSEGGMFAFQSGDQIKMVSIGPGTSLENKGKTTINIMSGTGTIPFQTQ